MVAIGSFALTASMVVFLLVFPLIFETSSALKVLHPVSTPTKLIVDTDVGSDDAIALLMTLGLEKRRTISGPKLMAVTGVHGNTNLPNVLQNILKTLKTAERLEIPVYAGLNASLTVTPPSDNYFGSDGFGDLDFPDPPSPARYVQKEHAVSALIRMATENPGEITVVAIGPLTNIALAIRLDPSFLSKIQQLVILGGSTEGVGNVKSGIEFNFYVDPEANFIVFNSTKGDNPIVVVPWETISERNHISMEWRKNILGRIPSKEIDLINKAEHYQINGPDTEPRWVSADPVTMGLVLRPDLIKSYEVHHVDAETQGSYGRGAVFVDYNDRISPKNTIIIKDFDVEGYKNLLIQTLS